MQASLNGSGATGEIAGGGRTRPLLELAAGVALLEAYLWSPRDVQGGALGVGVFAALAAVVCISYWRRGPEPPGGAAEPMTPTRAWAECVAVTVTAAAALLVVAWLLRDSYEHFELRFLERSVGRGWRGASAAALTVVGQQVMLQLFAWPVCRELLRSAVGGAVLAAVLFGLMHLPSATLVVMTTVAGLTWIWLYQRTGRLAPVIACHALLVLVAYSALPDRLSYDLRVGASAVEKLEVYRALDRADVRALLARVAASEYSAQAGGEGAPVVLALYRDVLGRAATAEELVVGTGWLRDHSRVELAKRLLGGEEFRQILRQRGDAALRLDSPESTAGRERRRGLTPGRAPRILHP